MIHDPSPHRVSACPVHFIWDGRGQGRVFVRLGFLGLVAAGIVASGARLLHVADGARAASLLVIGSVVLWSAGHMLGRLGPALSASRADPGDGPPAG